MARIVGSWRGGSGIDLTCFGRGSIRRCDQRGSWRVLGALGVTALLQFVMIPRQADKMTLALGQGSFTNDQLQGLYFYNARQRFMESGLKKAGKRRK